MLVSSEVVPSGKAMRQADRDTGCALRVQYARERVALNARQLSAARKRLAIVAHANDCTVDRCQRCAHALTLDTLALVASDLRLALDTLEATREQLNEMLRKDKT